MHMPNMHISIIMLLLTVTIRIRLVYSFLEDWLHYSPGSSPCQAGQGRFGKSYKNGGE